MAKVEKLVPLILAWEGGFSNHPNDTGGATNKGVTIGTFTQYRKQKGMPSPSVTELKNISDDEWMDILKTLYWDRWKADKINNQSIANLLVDWYWMSGSYGIKYPQEVLGVKADGLVGNITLSAINESDQKVLFDKLWERRKKHFDDIVKRNPSQQVFLNGWMNRLKSYKFS